MYRIKRNSSNSIQGLFSKYFIIMFISTSVVLLFFCVMLLRTNSQQMAYNTNTIANYYKYSLEKELDDSILFGQKLCYTDASFKMLSISNLSGSDKTLYLYNVNQALIRQVASYESIFIFNRNRSISAFASGSSYSFFASQSNYQLRESIRSYWLDNEAPQFNQWISYKDKDNSILMATQKYKNLYICTTIDLDKFDLIKYDNSYGNYMEFGFFNENEILSNHNALSRLNLSISALKKGSHNSFFHNTYIKIVPISGTDIRMFCIFHNNNIWSSAKIPVIIFIFIAIITCIILLYFFYHINKIVIYPLDQINAATKHLEQNDSSKFINNTNSNIVEYQNINNALANLINQKIILDDKNRSEAYEKDHARLQYYHLQTSSHFFVNCLKSLFNMLANKEYIKMQYMIIAFSNHLRYVFHDNLQLVTLEAELAEVNDYYSIIMLDRVTPLILNTNVDDALLKYQVPSLIIQTFLENTSKYNRQSDNLLIFDIKITPAELEGFPVMQIQISDNGIGYSKEILDLLNSSENNLFEKEHVGISNLKHRIALIYKSHFQYTFYNKPNGGACAFIYLPLLVQPEE